LAAIGKSEIGHKSLLSA